MSIFQIPRLKLPEYEISPRFWVEQKSWERETRLSTCGAWGLQWGALAS